MNQAKNAKNLAYKINTTRFILANSGSLSTMSRTVYLGLSLSTTLRHIGSQMPIVVLTNSHFVFSTHSYPNSRSNSLSSHSESGLSGWSRPGTMVSFFGGSVLASVAHGGVLHVVGCPVHARSVKTMKIDSSFMVPYFVNLKNGCVCPLGLNC